MSVTIQPDPANLVPGAHHHPDAEDSSFSHPKVQALVDRGVRVAVGYGALGSASKWTTLDEIQQLAAAGIAYLGCGELGQTSWRGGAATGRLHAAQLNAHYSNLRYPHDVALAVAFDSNISPADMAAAIAYGVAVADNLHWPFGIYGAIPIINALGYRSSFNWLTAATSWNRGERLLDGLTIHMIQSGGDATIGIDYDWISAPFMAWLGDAVDPPPPVVVDPLPPVVVQPPIVSPPFPPFPEEVPTAMLFYTNGGQGIWLLANGYMQHIADPSDAAHYASSGMPVVGGVGEGNGISVGELQRLLALYPQGPTPLPAPTSIPAPIVNIPAPIVNVPAPIVNVSPSPFPDHFTVTFSGTPA